MPTSSVLKIGLPTLQRAIPVYFTPVLVLMSAVFAACLFGIITRPINFLASVWPANAIMLGILLRYPASASPLGWLAGCTAYIAADLLTGAPLQKTLLLNTANIAGIAAGYAIFTRLPAGTIQLRHPTSMLLLMLTATVAGCAAGIVGALANPLLFGGTVLSGWTFWFATELVNYIAILPVVLSAPSRAELVAMRWENAKISTFEILPAAALLLSFIAAIVVGGPGAIAFPVPALLWCGLAYPVFATALCAMLFSLWTLIVLSAGYLQPILDRYDEMTLASVRLGATLVALVPIVLSTVMQSRNALLSQLHHIAAHDALTGVNNRATFIERAQPMLTSSGTFAVLMIDLDNFKSINDTYGHAAGDEVLITFARRARYCLREDDLIGRLGGEEFAVLVRNCTPAMANQIAERIRGALASEPIALSGNRNVPASVSIGMITGTTGAHQKIGSLLAAADTALYRAKNNGRNRVELA